MIPAASFMANITGISWCHRTWNPFVGCQRCAAECLHCYIERDLRKQCDWQHPLDPKTFRKPWDEVYLTQTWRDPYRFQKELSNTDFCRRVFTCSLSDFFIALADNRTVADGDGKILPMHEGPGQRCGSRLWRDCAWQVIRDTPQCVYLILTKRPENILSRLPNDWGEGYKNVWIGTSVGCKQTVSKLDSLRKVPVHPEAVRFVSCEPLIEDISNNINLEGIGWLICGGESGNNPEYLWESENHDWRKLLDSDGRRTMRVEWAKQLRRLAHRECIPFWFKQVTAPQPGQGEDALGAINQAVPPPPKGYRWEEKTKECAVIDQSDTVGETDPSVHVLDEDFVRAYLMRSDTRYIGRSRRNVLGKSEPPLPIVSFYMYQGTNQEHIGRGNWYVCQLSARGVGLQENIIAKYGPDEKQDALKCLKGLVATNNPLVVLE